MKIKGISPVVAEVIMISLAVIAGMLILSWTDYFSSSSHEKTNEKYTDMITCSKVIPQLDMLLIIKNTGSTKMMITNKGSLEYVIKKFELHTSKGICRVSKTFKIMPGKTQIITISCGEEGTINSCSQFKGLSIISSCIDKSIYFSKSLEDTGPSCKYENKYV